MILDKQKKIKTKQIQNAIQIWETNKEVTEFLKGLIRWEKFKELKEIDISDTSIKLSLGKDKGVDVAIQNLKGVTNLGKSVELWFDNLSKAFNTTGTDFKWNKVKDSLILSPHNKSKFKLDEETGKVVTFPLINDIVLALQIDRPTQFVYVTTDMVKEWGGVDWQGKAESNMKTYPLVYTCQLVELSNEKALVFSTNDTKVADVTTLLARPAELRRVVNLQSSELRGDVLVLVPSIGTLVVMGCSIENYVKLFGFGLSMENNKPISNLPFKLTADGFIEQA